MRHLRTTICLAIAGLLVGAALAALHVRSAAPSEELAHLEGYGRAAAEPPVRPVFPEHIRRFDMACYTRRQGAAAPDAGRPGRGPLTDAGPKNFEVTVDLDLMLYCGTDCGYSPRLPVAAADARRVVLTWHPGHTTWLRRSDGFYYEWLGAPGDEVRTGHCRRAGYTAFPEPYDGDRGRVPVATWAFPPGLRQFDMVCQQATMSWTSPPAGELPNVPLPEAFEGRLFRESVDLDEMLSCPSGCRASSPILSAGPGLVRFVDNGEWARWLYLDTGVLTDQRIGDGRVDWHVSSCVAAPFTSIPAWRPDSGRDG